jgi:hypothetical protein
MPGTDHNDQIIFLMPYKQRLTPIKEIKIKGYFVRVDTGYGWVKKLLLIIDDDKR